MKKLSIKIFIFFLLSSFLFSFSLKANKIGSETGYEIPRFVSLKSNNVNLRIGSSKNYPIILKYVTKNLPIKIIEEYGSWRKIIDIENNQGWIHKSLLKGDRYGIINQTHKYNLKILNKPKGNIIGEIGKNNLIKINRCLINWCLIEYKKNKGWIKKDNLWGVFKDEKFNIPFYQIIYTFIWKFNFLST